MTTAQIKRAQDSLEWWKGYRTELAKMPSDKDLAEVLEKAERRKERAEFDLRELELAFYCHLREHENFEPFTENIGNKWNSLKEVEKEIYGIKKIKARKEELHKLIAETEESIFGRLCYPDLP